MFDRSPIGLPQAVGVGYKPQHFSDILSGDHPVKWLEVHAENYMGGGGRPIAQLRALSEHYDISVHGVGLSIGSEQGLCPDHLDRLKHLLDWLNPAEFSEHLAWSTHDGHFLNDLLPVPYTANTLTRICAHIDQVQDHLGRRTLLENPSSYLSFSNSTYDEPSFLNEIAKRTGCGLLLDVNNIFVSATNLDWDPAHYVDALDLSQVGEVHIGGHHEDHDRAGHVLLIDSHSAPAVEPVWALLDRVLSTTGPKPVLVEWDTDVPEWPVLKQDAQRAKHAIDQVTAHAA